jgi:type III restriction enzyme
MERLEEYAAAEFSSLYHVNQRAIAGLHETRRGFYERLINSSSQPVSMPWELPESIDFTLHTDDELFDNHLFVDDDGSFKTNLNPWEKGVLIEELNNGAVCWLRNLDRKKWSLEIPYEVNGAATPMFPDLLIIRTENGGYVFDILEPHNPSLDDNWKKAVGMAKFAEKHWTAFGRIQLIKKVTGPDGKEHFYRLDMSDHTVRNKVRGITTDTELKRTFDDNAIRCD